MTVQKLRRPSLHYPNMPIYQLLKKTAERLPKKIAVIDPQGRRELTFRDIDRESDALAGIFLRWGIKKGDRISFFMPNGWEYFVGFYAAMKVGAVVSPMNPTFREREVKNQVNDAESRILLVQHDLFPVVERVLPDLPTLGKVIVTRETGKEGRKAFALEDLLNTSWIPYLSLSLRFARRKTWPLFPIPRARLA